MCKRIQRLCVLILSSLSVQERGEKCRLNSNADFFEYKPVIIRNGKLLEPTDKFGGLDLEYGESLTLSCVGTGFIHHPYANRQVTTATIKCDGGVNFKNAEWLNASAPFNLFTCPEAPIYCSRRTERQCYDGNRIIEVGYEIGNEFYPVYETCFNEITYNPIYSMYTQKPYNNHFQTRVQRPFFIDNNNYGSVPVCRLFSPGALRSAVTRQVGAAADNYFRSQNLSRGHLAAKTDFVYAFEERATFHYVNCAPQWTGFNGGNWNTLEVDLRNHVHAAELDTVIYTGTYGVTQLSDQSDRMVDIYLYTDVNNNPVIPVPQYFYKAVYEPQTQRGIVFVGINNPYYTPQRARELFFCEDVCRGDRRFSWLTWHPDNPYEGYTFCCRVPDFRRTVGHLPPFEATALLT